MSSPRRRTSDWNKIIPIFSPIISPFPKGIYTILVFDLKGRKDSREAVHTSISKVFSLGLVFLGFLVFT